MGTSDEEEGPWSVVTVFVLFSGPSGPSAENPYLGKIARKYTSQFQLAILRNSADSV